MAPADTIHVYRSHIMAAERSASLNKGPALLVCRVQRCQGTRGERGRAVYVTSPTEPFHAQRQQPSREASRQRVARDYDDRAARNRPPVRQATLRHHIPTGKTRPGGVRRTELMGRRLDELGREAFLRARLLTRCDSSSSSESDTTSTSSMYPTSRDSRGSFCGKRHHDMWVT